MKLIIKNVLFILVFNNLFSCSVFPSFLQENISRVNEDLNFLHEKIKNSFQQTEKDETLTLFLVKEKYQKLSISYEQALKIIARTNTRKNHL